jgi:sugar phosphate permease
MHATETMHTQTMRSWQKRIFIICWITYASYYLGRVNLAVALPAMQEQFGWNRTVAGLIGSSFYWVYAIGQLVNGQLGDRVSARRFVALGLGVSALLNVLFATSSSLLVMTALWMLNGWAQSTGWGPLMKTLSRWFSPQQRGRVTALFSPCYVAGHALSWAMTGWLVSQWGWRAAFWIPGLLLFASATAWYSIARDAPPSPAPQSEAAPTAAAPKSGAMDILGPLKGILRHPTLRWALGTCFLSGMIKDGLTLWSTTYLMEQTGLALPMAALSSVLIPIAGMGGAFLAGWLVRGGDEHGEVPVVLGLATLMVLTVLGLYAIGGTQTWWLPAGLMAATALASHGINAMLMSSLPLSLGAGGQVSSAAGTFDFASYVGGALSAILVGSLQDRFGWAAVYTLWVGVAITIAALAGWQRVHSRKAVATES